MAAVQETLQQVRLSEAVLRKTVMQATEVQCPRCFIILPCRLQAGDSCHGDTDKVVKYAEGLAKACEGLRDCRVAPNARDDEERGHGGDGDSKMGGVPGSGHDTTLFGPIVQRVQQGFNAWMEEQAYDVLWLYLVDEYTGLPVDDARYGTYPIKIKEPKKSLGRWIPLMNVGLAAMYAHNGAASIARLFGVPVPKVPKSLINMAGNLRNAVLVHGSLAHFKCLQESFPPERVCGANDGSTEAASGQDTAQTAQGAALRELHRFLREHDEGCTYAGLRRAVAEDGTVFWTRDDKALVYCDVHGGSGRDKEQRGRDEDERMHAAPSAGCDDGGQGALGRSAVTQPQQHMQQGAQEHADRRLNSSASVEEDAAAGHVHGMQLSSCLVYDDEQGRQEGDSRDASSAGTLAAVYRVNHESAAHSLLNDPNTSDMSEESGHVQGCVVACAGAQPQQPMPRREEQHAKNVAQVAAEAQVLASDLSAVRRQMHAVQRDMLRARLDLHLPLEFAVKKRVQRTPGIRAKRTLTLEQRDGEAWLVNRCACLCLDACHVCMHGFTHLNAHALRVMHSRSARVSLVSFSGVCMCVHMYMYVCMYVCTYVTHASVCTRVIVLCTHVCVYACLCACLYIHAYTYS